MNHPHFTELRRQVDNAITFNDLSLAREHARRGLFLAEQKECLGERMYFLAQLHIIDEDFQDAIIFLDKAIAFNSSDGAAYNDKALCYISLGRIEGAMELFNKGIEVEPGYATIHHNKGWFLNKLGLYQEALESLREALKIEPGRAVTYENIANVYENMGLVDEARAAYQEALKCTDNAHGDIQGQIRAQIERLDSGNRSV